MSAPLLPQAVIAGALAAFGVRAARVIPLARRVVRVDTSGGETFALRCTPRSDRGFRNIPLELAWTAALRRDTDIAPPEALPGRDGALVQEVCAADAPKTGAAELYDGVLFTWIPGTPLAEQLTPDSVRRLGELSARLHAHAVAFTAPEGVPVRLLDGWLRGAERDVLFAHDHAQFLPPQRRAVFDEVGRRFRGALEALYRVPTGRRVIDADLHQENIVVDGNRLRPLDFYEAIFGYPIRDIALTFFDLRYSVDYRRLGTSYERLRDTFAQGYAMQLPWPEPRAGTLDLLVAGRRLRQANWVLQHETARFAPEPAAVPEPAAITRYFERLEAEFRELLASA